MQCPIHQKLTAQTDFFCLCSQCLVKCDNLYKVVKSGNKGKQANARKQGVNAMCQFNRVHFVGDQFKYVALPFARFVFHVRPACVSCKELCESILCIQKDDRQVQARAWTQRDEQDWHNMKLFQSAFIPNPKFQNGLTRAILTYHGALMAYLEKKDCNSSTYVGPGGHNE